MTRIEDQQSGIETNLEGLADFNFEWSRCERYAPGGMTAVLRVKNEVRNIPWVLPPLLRTLDRVIIVDNGSTDGTRQKALDVATEAGEASKLDVLLYPHRVARAGAEHLATPPASLHSLTYFYNWCFSHVETAYALKWDGDMLLSRPGQRALRDLTWRLEAVESILTVPRISLYVASMEEGFIDLELRNREPWGWPNRPGYQFGKGLEWELQLRPGHSRSIPLPFWACFEIKWLDQNEFDHWTPETEFTESIRTQRKSREIEIFSALSSGDQPSGLAHVKADSAETIFETIERRSAHEWAEWLMEHER